MTPELWKLVIVLMFALLVAGLALTAAMRWRKQALDALRYAIDKGQPLDPAVVRTLVGQSEFVPASLMFPGIMTTALSIGVGITGFLWDRPRFYGASAILLCLGIGLLVSSRILPQDNGHQGNG